MRNYNENQMINQISFQRELALMPKTVVPVVLTEGDKAGIQSFRNRIERAQNKRKPIFDRTKLLNTNTLGYKLGVVELNQAAKFGSFGQLVAAELQKAGL